MANLNKRIEEMIGTDYTTIAATSYLDLFNAAVNEIADTIPSDVLLKYADNPADLDASPTTWTSIEGSKVLLVTRKDSAAIWRECKAVSLQDFEKTKDSKSIYFATEHSPVFALTTDAGATALEIAPIPTDAEPAKVYYYAYSRISDIATATIANFPPELEQAVVLKASINILNTYISDMVQDEEDSELQQMLTAQIGSLAQMYQQEMSRYIDPEAPPIGE
jgi:hypothetical protein